MRVAGQADKAVDRGRDQDQRLQPDAVADPLQLQRQAEAAIGDKRKRMRRVDRQRRQHREDVGHEALFEPGAVARFEIGRLDDRDPGLGAAARASASQVDLLVLHQRAGALVDRLELLRRGQPVLAQRLDAGEMLAFEPGHPHHVELVEVARRDRQEAQPLEQRMAPVFGLGQHPLVEGQPRQLAIDEARRRRRLARPDLDDFARSCSPQALLARRVIWPACLARFYRRM